MIFFCLGLRGQLAPPRTPHSIPQLLAPFIPTKKKEKTPQQQTIRRTAFYVEKAKLPWERGATSANVALQTRHAS
jgi:hypothetical protein